MMRPCPELVRYNGPNEFTGLWEVRTRGAAIAATYDQEAAIAAFRLLAGEAGVRSSCEYLRTIGCKPGHVVLDALEGRATVPHAVAEPKR